MVGRAASGEGRDRAAVSAMGAHSAQAELVGVLTRRCREYEDTIATLREQLEEKDHTNQ